MRYNCDFKATLWSLCPIEALWSDVFFFFLHVGQSKSSKEEDCKAGKRAHQQSGYKLSENNLRRWKMLTVTQKIGAGWMKNRPAASYDRTPIARKVIL